MYNYTMATKEEREKFIKDRLALEEGMAEDMNIEIRDYVYHYLIEKKGYSPEDLHREIKYFIEFCNKNETVSMDIIINIGGRSIVSIKCSPASLESRERHIVSFSRIVEPYQIPLSIVTNGDAARMLDTITGGLIAERLSDMPSKEELEERLSRMEFKEYPKERLEREKKILFAFEGIKCCIIDTKKSSGSIYIGEGCG